MPEQFDPAWEYYEPNPEIAELFAESGRAPDLIDVIESGAFTGGVLSRGFDNRTKTPNALCVACGKPFVSRFSGPRRSTNCSYKCAWVTRKKKRHPWLRPATCVKPRTENTPRLFVFRCDTCGVVDASRFPNKRYCSYDCNPNSRHQKASVMANLVLSLEDAQEMIKRGVVFGDVFPFVDPVYQEMFKEWFVREPGLPVLPGGQRRDAPALQPRRTTFIDLNPCSNCGCSEFVPGACPTCANCGESPRSCG